MFEDEYAIIFDDPEHSKQEERMIILGVSKQSNLLIVCHCFRDNDNIIRIISARKATNNEERQYIEINRGW